MRVAALATWLQQFLTSCAGKARGIMGVGTLWRAETAPYTAYTYIEDDTQVPWRAMVA